MQVGHRDAGGNVYHEFLPERAAAERAAPAPRAAPPASPSDPGLALLWAEVAAEGGLDELVATLERGGDINQPEADQTTTAAARGRRRRSAADKNDEDDWVLRLEALNALVRRVGPAAAPHCAARVRDRHVALRLKAVAEARASLRPRVCGDECV